MPNIKALERENIDVDKCPYAEEKIFKVSKAITKHLAGAMKTNEGLFLETSANDHLK